MPRQTLANLLPKLLLSLLTAVSATCFAVFLLLVAGVLPTEPPNRVASAGQAASSDRAPLSDPVEPEPTREPEAAVETPPPAATPAPPPVTTVIVTATRGASWVSARLGSATGRVLEERLLAQGESTRLTGPRIWLLVGASGNVDVEVNGKPRALAPGTVETVFTPPRA
ncbi:MAG: DUF4115 domain-containing protein [Gaiellaceae bacterium]